MDHVTTVHLHQQLPQIILHHRKHLLVLTHLRQQIPVYHHKVPAMQLLQLLKITEKDVEQTAMDLSDNFSNSCCSFSKCSSSNWEIRIRGLEHLRQHLFQVQHHRQIHVHQHHLRFRQLHHPIRQQIRQFLKHQVLLLQPQLLLRL